MTFQQWLASQDQTPFTYHTGYLPRDRKLHRIIDGRLHTFPSPVDLTARVALDAQRAGRVQLVQRRIGPDIFEYVAQRAHQQR